MMKTLLLTAAIAGMTFLEANAQNEQRMYTYKQIGNKYVVSVNNREEIVKALTTFCEELKILSGSIAGIGAVDELTLRFFNPETKKYEDKSFREQMEITNLTGNISTMNGKAYLHIHATVGRSDYSALGGHLLAAVLNGAGEFVVEDYGTSITRTYNPALGLNCYDLHPKGNDGNLLTISFQFHRGGIASSQYAIWIEDKEGKIVRTLYATSFTAEGGYKYREDAIPEWVRKAEPGKMTSAQVDAVTGATPPNGNLTYEWDGTDDNGKPVPSGVYRFFIEGSLYWKSRVVYTGEVNWGGKEQPSIPVSSRFFNPSPTNKNMITELKVSLVKKN